MSVLSSMAIIIIAMITVNNYPLSQFLGICPFLGVSTDLDSAKGMGIAVTFVMTLATAVTWCLETFILDPLGLHYLQTLSFILVIAALVQFIEMFMKKNMPPLYKAMGIYLPLITTNCAVLGVCIDNFNNEYNFFQSIAQAFGGGLGFWLALTIMAGVRSKMVDQSKMPKAFQGLPIVLTTAAILALAFMGFSGMFA